MFRNFTVLYVEDEVGILTVITKTIGKFFKNFYTKENGKDALEFFKEHQDEIDIVITDINMPKMDGLTMSMHIKEIDCSTPIIIASAYNDKDFLHKAIGIGINGYVLKPLDIQKLLVEIEKSLEPIALKRKLDEQEELNQLERLKSAKFSAIGQLAAGITHEINTPLTYIKGSFDIMLYDLEELPDSQIKQDILKQYDRINDGLKRISNIVNSMREMSQQSTESKEDANIYETVVVSATMAYNRAKHISHIYINDKLFSLDFDKNSESFTAFVQKQRIEQVWVIIINNALDELMKIDDYKQRELHIDIQDEPSSVKVTFKDNAGGIPENIFDKLFEPFKSTKDSSGMGIGLSIAKKIIDEQGGTIEAYNQNDGAVFEITINKNENNNTRNSYE